METEEMTDHLLRHHQDEQDLVLPQISGIEGAILATFDAGEGAVAVLDEEAVLDLLEAQCAADGDENPQKSAEEWYAFNIACAYLGPRTPIFAVRVERGMPNG